MRMTTKGRYAVRAMVYLAGAERTSPFPAGQIAQEEAISPEFLEQIFYRLKKAGIIRSVRGPRGGFSLMRSPEKIFVLDILEAVGEEIYPAPCAHSRENCRRSEHCKLASLWQNLYDLQHDYLRRVSLRDIISEHCALDMLAPAAKT
jgi:Rrf2 family iron-sulfur cluster assembly transcriptional regulator